VPVHRMEVYQERRTETRVLEKAGV
jgi:hypothetical protein